MPGNCTTQGLGASCLKLLSHVHPQPKTVTKGQALWMEEFTLLSAHEVTGSLWDQPASQRGRTWPSEAAGRGGDPGGENVGWAPECWQ